MAESFQFDLVSPEKLLFSEAVSQVIVPGSEGYMTVMANHSPTMTGLKPGVVEATLADGSEQRIFVRGGFADITPSGFTLLAEQAIDMAEFDSSHLDQEIKNAEEDVADAADDEKKQAAQLKLDQLSELKAALGS